MSIPGGTLLHLKPVYIGLREIGKILQPLILND